MFVYNFFFFNEIHLSTLQFSLGLDGKKLEPESNVLLASIENMQYAVTLDVLHMVFTITGSNFCLIV